MPLYEYQCDACGHRFEVIQKFSDKPLETCPKCGGAVHKLVSSPAFQFKGSGWYITDYAKKSDAKSEGKSSSSGGGDSKESAKPAADTSSKDSGSKNSGNSGDSGSSGSGSAPATKA